MRKKCLFVLVCCLVLLVGCSSQDYKDSVKSGKEALEQKNYDKAITEFHNAAEFEPLKTESQELLQQDLLAQEQVFQDNIATAITNHKAFIDKQE